MMNAWRLLVISTLVLTMSVVTAPPSAAATEVPGPGGDVPRVVAVPITNATAVRLSTSPNDAVWVNAPKVSEFVQREPREGEPATFQTEVRVAYDASALYVAVWAFDPDPAKLVGLLTRRDGDSPSDWIRVMIDSYHDKRTAYEFAVNPAGVKVDEYWFADGNQDRSWDAVWDVQVSQDREGWKAAFRIPFSQLRFNPGGDHVFGFAVIREIARLKETTCWPLVAKSKSGIVSQFGELTGLQLTESRKKLEIVPYSVAQVATQPTEAGNPFVRSADPAMKFGADLKYAVTPGLNLTATLNPDFGQVEADPAVVNLSAFETFFSERRPFFVESSGTYQFDLDCNDGSCTGLFYSRRIGRAPRGSPDVPDGGFSSTPGQTTILGAAKLSGRIGSFSVGALNALTAEESAEIANGHLRTTQTVEPLTSYSVVRSRREFANQSNVGFMFTATNRRLTPETGFLPSQAYTGGVDWDLRLRKSTYSISGYWAGSSVRGSEEAISGLQESSVHSFQRPDAGYIEYDPTRTAMNGQAGQLAVNKIGGDRVRFTFVGSFKTPGFEVNDLGYMRRADEVTGIAWVQLRQEKPAHGLRTFRVNFNQWSMFNFGGDRRDVGGNINAHAVFMSNWQTGMGVNVDSSGLADRLTRGGPAVRTNSSFSIWHYVITDDRKVVSFETQQAYGTDHHGSWAFEVDPAIVVRPGTALSISGGLAFSRNVDLYQWVANITDTRTHYVFGDLDQKTISLTARVNYAITPTLSVQIYAQPFVSAGAYGRYKELVNPRAPSDGDRFAPYDYPDSADFNYRSFRTTNVLRWEFKPGSALFVVWQQGRQVNLPNGDFRFGRDVGGIFHAPAQNVFLVKLSYWLNP
jgi:hypothetical protein